MKAEDTEISGELADALDAVEEFADAALEATETAARRLARNVESVIEVALFTGRWMLAPLYLGLVLSLAGLVIKFAEEFVHLSTSLWAGSINATTLDILGLLDITLLGNLIVIMIFSGYENFVSKINVAEDSEDRPTWMGKVDYSGLKIKLIGSLVAISVIELLKDFMEKQTLDPTTEKWRIAIHLTFVVSGLLFAIMDYVADRRTAFEFDIERKALDAEKARLELDTFRHEHQLHKHRRQ